MGDHLEEFIIKNRDSFDEGAPSAQSWKKINKRLHKSKRQWSLTWRSVAVLFMASTIFLIVNRKTSIQEEEPILTQEFTQAEDYYVRLITQKRQAIKEQLIPEQQEPFLVEIDQLDSIYLALKTTYQINASNDRVMDAMINNLRLRLDILNRQLEFLQNINPQKNEKNKRIKI